jgi:PAS domain S-box-containing protein
MQIFQNTPIRRKQTLIIMLTSTVALLIACAAFIAYDTVTFRRELSERVTILADAVGNNCAAAIDFNDLKAAEETLTAFRADDNIVSACVYSRDGRVFAIYQRDTALPFVPPAVQPASQKFTSDELHLFRAIKQGGVMTGTIFVASDLKELSARLVSYVAIVGVVFLSSLLAALLLSGRLQRLVSDPILHLAQVTRSVAVDKNYSLRATKQSGDEIGQLVDSFNEMLAQIQQRDAALQAARGDLELRVQERTKELAESQSLYHSLVDQMPAAVFRKDAEGRYVFVNTLFCQVTQMSPDQILGRTSSELVASMSAVQSTKRPVSDKLGTQGMSHHESIMRTGRQIVVEDEYQGSDGRRNYYQTVKSAVFGAEGQVIGSQGILFNITERKSAEEALRESQALYLSLVDQMPAGVFRKDLEGRFVFVNSWYCELKGIKADRFLGKTPVEVATSEMAVPGTKYAATMSDPEIASQGENHHVEILQTGRTIEIEEQYSDMDGKVHSLRVVKSPVFDSDSKIVGTQGMLFDITERKQAEAELSYERDLLRSLLDSSPDQIYFKDIQSRFIKSSQAQAVNFGLKSADELVGLTDFDFFTEEHARPAFEDEQEIIRTGRPLIGRVEKEAWKDGRVSWVLTNKIPLRNKDGRIIGTFGISKDITAIKEAEVKLEQVHKQLLETSRQAGMAEIATNVLHNIGNVLNSVNVSASLVSDKVKKSKVSSVAKVVVLLREHEHDLGTFFISDPRGRQLSTYLARLSEQLLADQTTTVHELDLLVKNIGHIKDIVTMQQSYARVSGVKEIINIRELVEDGLRMNVGALGRHGVEVIREFADVPLINIDRHKVLQVLVNLIRNAKHACQDSERADKRLTVRVADGDGRIRISVSDNGIGIPPENLTRIFSHGFTTKKNGHGFGLHSGALAAREMGGSLNVQSDGINHGATFTLELPCDTNKDSNE